MPGRFVLKGKLVGGNALDDLLAQLPDRMTRKVAGNALRAAARVVAAQQRKDLDAQTKPGTGELRRAIQVKAGRVKKEGTRKAYAGVFPRGATAKRGRSNEAPLAHLIEGGTKPHVIRPKRKGVRALKLPGPRFAKIVHHPGTAPRPFIAPSVDRAGPAALDKMREVAANGLAREVERLKAQTRGGD